MNGFVCVCVWLFILHVFVCMYLCGPMFVCFLVCIYVCVCLFFLCDSVGLCVWHFIKVKKVYFFLNVIICVIPFFILLMSLNFLVFICICESVFV